MLSDIEIARAATMRPIGEIAAGAGIDEKLLEYYGPYKAKVNYLALRDVPERARLILVTAINPTPAGEGKTTVSIGLADALRARGKNVCLALREPSLGPVFGVKGGATGGGYGVLSSYCYVWRDGQEIPLGHDWQETARVEPTETEDGYADYVCTKCAETRRDVLPKTGTVDPTDPTDPTEPTEPPMDPTDPTENGNERSMFLEANAKYSDPAAVRCTAGGLRRKIGACKGTRGLPGAARRARGLSGGPRSGAGGQLHRRLARHGAAGLRCEREL